MALKNLLSSFSAEARKQRQFDKAVSKLVSRNYQHEDRMFVIEQLAELDTPQAIAALFRRWDMIADKKREDVAEKEYLADVLAAKGERVLEALRNHNDRSLNITRPIGVLARIVDEEAVVTELIRILETEQARLAAFKPGKKLRIIELLGDYLDDPRLTAALVPSLDDFDADVRFECARLLGKVGSDEARDPLISRLTHEDEDSARVKEAVLEAIKARGWKVTDRKDDLGELGDALRIGPKGNLIDAD